MRQRNWLELSRKLVDTFDMNFSFTAVQNFQGEQALAFFGEGVAATTTYPNPFVVSLSGSSLGGSVGVGIGYDPNGQLTRIDPGSTTSTAFTIAPSDPSNPRWDLLVIRYAQTGDTLIPKPSDPISSIDLNLHDDFVLAVVEGTSSATPSYPAKGALDIILGGIRVPAGATLGTQCTLDLTKREFAEAFQFALPQINQEKPAGVVNGTNHIFTLSALPIGMPAIFVDNLKLTPAQFSVSGQNVTIVTAPALGQNVDAYYAVNSSSSTNPITGVDETPSGVVDGVNALFQLSGTPVTKSSAIVFVDGIRIANVGWNLIIGAGSSQVQFNAGYVPAIGQDISVFYLLNVLGVGLSGGGSASVSGAANLGGMSSVGLFSSLSSSILKFKSLISGANVTITDNGDGTVTIAASGGGGGGGSGALQVYGSEASPIIVDPTVGIPATTDARALRFVVGESGMGGQPITASPQIAAGTTIGQELLLKGTSSDYPIIQQAGVGVSLNGDMLLKANSSIYLVWDGDVWSEISRR